MLTAELIGLHRNAVPSDHVRAYVRNNWREAGQWPQWDRLSQIALQGKLDETMYEVDAMHLLACKLMIRRLRLVLSDGPMRVIPITKPKEK